MATSKYLNNGPIYLTYSAYQALVSAGTVVIGQEYRFTDIKNAQLITGTSAPTTSTSCLEVGALYLNTTTNLTYICTAISGSTYTWTALAGGSSGVEALDLTASNVTQTTFTVDKTSTEVAAAITAGKLIRLNITTLDTNVYKLIMTQHKASGTVLNFEVTINNYNYTFALSAPEGSTTYEGTITSTIFPAHNITVSSENPSGGSDGDIWLKYEV